MLDRADGFRYVGTAHGRVFWVHCPCRDLGCEIHVWWDGDKKYLHQHGDNPEALLLVDAGEPNWEDVVDAEDPDDLRNPFTAWSYRVHEWLASGLTRA